MIIQHFHARLPLKKAVIGMEAISPVSSENLIMSFVRLQAAKYKKRRVVRELVTSRKRGFDRQCNLF